MKGRMIFLFFLYLICERIGILGKEMMDCLSLLWDIILLIRILVLFFEIL